MVDELIATGTVKGRPAIGITVGAMPDSAAEYFDLPKGLYVMDVAPGSDAEAQGIRVGDIVTAINGEGVHETSDVAAIISQYDVGTIMTFTIYRDGETLQVDVTLMETSDIYQYNTLHSFSIHFPLSFCKRPAPRGRLLVFRRKKARPRGRAFFVHLSLHTKACQSSSWRWSAAVQSPRPESALPPRPRARR